MVPSVCKSSSTLLGGVCSGLKHGVELAKLLAKTAYCKTVDGRDAPLFIAAEPGPCTGKSADV
jgi:hypothetical protein